MSTDLLLDTKEQVLNLIALGIVDPVELALDAFADVKDVLLDLETRLAATFDQVLPLIGMSLNDLFIQADFDLFGEFEAAFAPLASELSGSGLLVDRFAELAQLLEGAFEVADVEIVYDETELSIDITFDFNLDQVLALSLDEFGLDLGLGIAFTLSLDLTELIAVSAGGSSDGGSQLILALSSSVEIDADQFDLSGSATVEIALSDLYGGEVPDITLTGDATINLGGYVLLAGGFALSKSSQSDVNLGEDNGTLNLDVDLLRIDLTNVDLFVGAGGVLDTTTDPDDYAVDASDGTGFFVDGANLSLAIASVTDATLPDTRRWTGVVASADGLEPVGLPAGFELQVRNLEVLFNTASGDDGAGTQAQPIDWSVLYTHEADALNTLNGDTALSVSGDITIDLGGYVLVAGEFAVSKTTPTDVDLTAVLLDVDVDLLRIDLTNVDLFVGAGGVFDTSNPDDYAVDVTDATGFFVNNANLSLAIASVTDATPNNPATDKRRWTGLAANVDGLLPVGLPAGFELQVRNLEVRFNTASGNDGAGHDATRINWSDLVADTNPLNALDAATVLAVSGDITIDLGGYVLVAGEFAVSKTTPTDVDLTADLQDVDVDLLRIDLTNVDLFVGAGGVFDTTNPDDYAVVATDDVATGFLVHGADLNLAIASVTDAPAADKRRWTGLAANVDGLGPVGLPAGFELQVRNLEVRFNTASGNDGAGHDATRINWSDLVADTNPLNALDAATVLAVSGDITINLDGYVLVAGEFAVSKTTPTDVDLTADLQDVDVDLLRIDLTNVDLFVGAGGVFDTTNPDDYAVVATDDVATGFLVHGADLYLAIASVTDAPAADKRRWTGLAANVDGLGPVGLPAGFELQVRNLEVRFNTASGNDGAGHDATRINWSDLVLTPTR